VYLLSVTSTLRIANGRTFEKFLLAADGSVISRFRPGVEPQDPRLVTAIEQVVGA
jgi:glutathione peroxidase-family protein